MIYDMCVVTVRGAFGGVEKFKVTFPKECEILDVLDLGPVWKTAKYVPYVASHRFKVLYRYDKNNPPGFIKGGE